MCTRETPGEVAQARSAIKYAYVTLGQKNKQVGCYVHRLVLEAFVGPCPEGMRSRRKNGDPLDNALSNLEWDTHCGERQCNSKLTEVAVREIRSSPMGDRMFAEKFGVSITAVSLARRGKAWKHLK